jgi:hypothetical protein
MFKTGLLTRKTRALAAGLRQKWRDTGFGCFTPTKVLYQGTSSEVSNHALVFVHSYRRRRTSCLQACELPRRICIPSTCSKYRIIILQPRTRDAARPWPVDRVYAICMKCMFSAQFQPLSLVAKRGITRHVYPAQPQCLTLPNADMPGSFVTRGDPEPV